MSTYGGESNAKKIARATFWAHVSDLRWHSGGRKRSDRVLVLCGPTAADVRAVTALGISPSRVTAVDLDEEYISEFRLGEPRAEYVCEDVFRFLSRKRLVGKKKKRRKFDVVFLDFCGVLSPGMVREVVRVAKNNVNHMGIIGIGVMYGRESGDTGREIATSDMGVTGAPPWMKRSGYLIGRATRELVRSRVMLVPVIDLMYRSGRTVSGKNVGSPMIYTAYIVHKARGSIGLSSYAKTIYRKMDESERDHNNVVKAIGDDARGVKVRELAIKLCSGGLDISTVSCLLNLKRQQIAAWKAWDTRRGAA